MKKKIVEIYGISSDDLKNEIVSDILTQFRKEFQLITKSLQQHQNPEFITSKDACKILGVTLPTLLDWRKRKIIIAYRIGNKIRFKKLEIENSIKKIN